MSLQLLSKYTNILLCVKSYYCKFSDFVNTKWTLIIDLSYFLTIFSNINCSKQCIFFSLQSGCKLLNALLRYTQTSNYFWMFCEGFYLHRLIVHAFKVPKGLLGYYVMGWGKHWNLLLLNITYIIYKCYINVICKLSWMKLNLSLLTYIKS